MIIWIIKIINFFCYDNLVYLFLMKWLVDYTECLQKIYSFKFGDYSIINAISYERKNCIFLKKNFFLWRLILVSFIALKIPRVYKIKKYSHINQISFSYQDKIFLTYHNKISLIVDLTIRKTHINMNLVLD